MEKSEYSADSDPNDAGSSTGNARQEEPDLEADGTYLSEEEMIEEGRAAAILGYVPFLCFIPLIRMRHNKFAYRHGKQGLFLFFMLYVRKN